MFAQEAYSSQHHISYRAASHIRLRFVERHREYGVVFIMLPNRVVRIDGLRICYRLQRYHDDIDWSSCLLSLNFEMLKTKALLSYISWNISCSSTTLLKAYISVTDRYAVLPEVSCRRPQFRTSSREQVCLRIYSRPLLGIYGVLLSELFSGRTSEGNGHRSKNKEVPKMSTTMVTNTHELMGKYSNYNIVDGWRLA